jgi:hypothetical protein
MNLTNLLIEGGQNITLSIGLNDLREWHKEVIADAKKELEDAVVSEKMETYPTPAQVAEILGVDNVTLWRWKKKGYLVPANVGGKIRYKMSEVKALLNGERVTK